MLRSSSTANTTMAPNRIPTDREAVEASWSERGFSCALWIDPPEQVRKDFEHDVDELVLLTRGLAQIELADQVVKLEAGDELLIPAGVRHTIRNCGSGPAHWLHGYPLAQANEGVQEAGAGE